MFTDVSPPHPSIDESKAPRAKRLDMDRTTHLYLQPSVFSGFYLTQSPKFKISKIYYWLMKDHP